MLKQLTLKAVLALLLVWFVLIAFASFAGIS